MASTTIRVSEETKRRLDVLKRTDESYEAVIRRLAERDRWAGFGAFSEADADDAAAGVSEVREDLNEEFSERVDRIGDR